MVLIVIDCILPHLYPINVASKIECVGVCTGKVKANPMAFLKDVAGRPDFDFIFINFIWLYWRRMFVCIVWPITLAQFFILLAVRCLEPSSRQDSAHWRKDVWMLLTIWHLVSQPHAKLRILFS